MILAGLFAIEVEDKCLLWAGKWWPDHGVLTVKSFFKQTSIVLFSSNHNKWFIPQQTCVAVKLSYNRTLIPYLKRAGMTQRLDDRLPAKVATQQSDMDQNNRAFLFHCVVLLNTTVGNPWTNYMVMKLSK